VGPGLDGDESVDCTGGYLSRGFMDCHVHVTLDASQMRILETPFSLQFYSAAANLKKTLDIGLTTVRDAGGADLGIKEAVDRGMIPGPRMQISIIMVSQTGGHGDDWSICGGDVPFFLPSPDARAASRTARTRCASECATSSGPALTSSRSQPRRVWSPPRPTHDTGTSGDAEIAVMTEEATAAGIHVMAHAQGAGAASRPQCCETVSAPSSTASSSTTRRSR
jgi:imidazolonepropionase-like amidohydrolase